MSAPVSLPTWALRIVAALGPAFALLAGVPEGYSPPLWLVVLVVAGGVGYAWAPDHVVGWLVMLVVVVWWTLTLRGEMPVGVLVASAALLAAHVSGLVLGYGPPYAAVAGSLRSLWVVRATLVWLSAPVIWVVARGYSGHATPAIDWTIGVGVAAAGAVLVAITFPTADRDHGE